MFHAAGLKFGGHQGPRNVRRASTPVAVCSRWTEVRERMRLFPSSLFLPSIFLTLAFFLPAARFSQGFGTIRGDKVVLHRKLPAMIHLTGTTISVKTAAHTRSKTIPRSC